MRAAPLALVLAALAIGRSVSAQVLTPGVLAGAAGTYLDYGWHGDYVRWDARPGFVGGLSLDWAGSHRFFVRQEMVLAMKAASARIGPRTDRATLTYMELPVLVGFRATYANGRAVFMAGGPVYSRLLAARHRLTRDGTTTTDDMRDQFASSERLWLLDVGVNGAGPWGGLFRFSIGAGNIATDPDVNDLRTVSVALALTRRWR